MSNYLRQNSIKWHFIPARSPHFGGLWEATVKLVKRHLLHITKNVNFTFEELTTIFAQIEAIINSRPLIPLSSDPNDFTYLSPAHFLIGNSLMAVPESNLQDITMNKLNHYQRIQQIQQHFWSKWSKDYLITLQKLTKWKQGKGPCLRVGSLVLLRENTPPLYWRLGRIIAVHPGKDNVIRAATIKTSTGTVKRAVTQLSELYSDNNETEK